MLKLHFKTITPLHISNGEQLGVGLDYILLKRKTNENKKLCRLNWHKLAEGIAKSGQIDYKKNYGLKEITNIIKDYLSVLFNSQTLTDDYFTYNVDISKQFSDFYDSERREGMKFVQEFINSNGKFYVPASSIKGALLTVLNINKMGIDSISPDINDKFVICDSANIDPSKFNVMQTNDRPPKVNLICLNKDVDFVLPVRKTGKLDLSKLKNSLKEYSESQITNALNKIIPYKTTRDQPKGADIFEQALMSIKSINLLENEYLINLGFGGGSWFKIEKGKIPEFQSKKPRARRGDKEPAHTSVSFYENPVHIGWCKLKIEEN